MRAKIEEAKALSQEIPVLKAELERLRREALEVQERSLEKAMPDKVLALMQDAERASGVKLLSLQEVAYTEEGNLGLDRYVAEFEGRYPGLREVLDRLGEWPVLWRLVSWQARVEGTFLRGRLEMEVPVARREALRKLLEETP